MAEHDVSKTQASENLLHSDGFIFVSIDSHEVSNLKIIMDDIFGEECYRNTIAVRRGIKMSKPSLKM